MSQSFPDNLHTMDELRKKLLHSDRLAAVGQLAAGVAHQINNPVAFIQTNFVLLQEYISKLDTFYSSVKKYTDNEHKGEHAKEINDIIADHNIDLLLRNVHELITENLEGIDRIRSLVRDLRVFSRSNEKDIEQIHIDDIATTACNMTYNEIRHRAQLQKEIHKTRPIIGSRSKLTQVIMNLLLNAAHSINEGDATRNTITLSIRESNNDVVITVSDTGSGIPENIQERIFDAFFTTKSTEIGTGLGLSLSKEIIERHKGSITLKSHEGEGSSFTVTLPFDTGYTLDTQIIDNNEDQDTTTGVKILIIDDEPIILKSYRRMLSPPNDVTTVERGSDALKILKKNGKDFDVIICDLMMPDTDAPMIFDALKHGKPEMLNKFIFHSGGAFTSRVRSFMDSIENIILEKPVTKQQLTQAISTVSNVQKNTVN